MSSENGVTASVVTPFWLWAMGARRALACVEPRLRARVIPFAALLWRRTRERHAASVRPPQRAAHGTPGPAAAYIRVGAGPRSGPSSARIAPHGVAPRRPRRDSIPRCDVVARRMGSGTRAPRASGGSSRAGVWDDEACLTRSGPVRGAVRCASPQPREGRGSAERPSVAGAPTARGVPTFAATARPRRGSHAPTGAVVHDPPSESNKAPSTQPGAPRTTIRPKSLTRPRRPCTRRPTASQRHRRPRRAP